MTAAEVLASYGCDTITQGPDLTWTKDMGTILAVGIPEGGLSPLLVAASVLQIPPEHLEKRLKG